MAGCSTHSRPQKEENQASQFHDSRHVSKIHQTRTRFRKFPCIQTPYGHLIRPSPQKHQPLPQDPKLANKRGDEIDEIEFIVDLP